MEKEEEGGISRHRQKGEEEKEEEAAGASASASKAAEGAAVTKGIGRNTTLKK